VTPSDIDQVSPGSHLDDFGNDTSGAGEICRSCAKSVHRCCTGFPMPTLTSDQIIALPAISRAKIKVPAGGNA
jgi:hypothetical protein